MSISLQAIPFKQAEPISFNRALKTFIQEEYEEDPDNYAEDFEALEGLRSSIQNPQVHESSASTHLSYYAQLHFLETKFDISEERVKLFFTWANAFGKQENVSSHNIGFEKASVLFNVGAIYSKLAIAALSSSGNNSEESLKKAAQYFQQSSGAYQTIIDKLPEWNIQGSANLQLNALSNLMLSQAQEVFFLKAASGKMKEGTLAKLAMQTATFYGVSLDIAQECSVFDKNWISFMTVKQFQYVSVAHYYKSIESEANGKYGEQVAWLTSGVAAIKSALNKQLTKYLESTALETELTSFSSMLNNALEKANKDNDKIYMETIPKDLPPLTPARMVNPVKIPEYNTISVQRHVFRNLVPLKIHQSASAYAYQKDTLIKNLCSKLSEATVMAHTTLASQKLPGSIEALEQPIGLPSLVLERSIEVRQKGGARSIESSWATLSNFAKQDWELLNQSVIALDQEERDDDELKRLYGGKWTRTPSSALTKKLREKGKEYREKIEAADKSNQLVRTKMDKNLVLIEHLGMDKSELEASIPSSTTASTLALKDPNLKALKGHLDVLNKNIRQRADLIARLKKTGEADDIGPRLTANTLKAEPAEESSLFEKQLKVYDEYTNLIKQLISEQEKSLELIFTSNKAFLESHQTNEMIREREAALSNLDIGYKHFKDISANLDEGIKFFSDLEAILLKFKEHCLDFVKARNLDKDQLLSQIQMGGMNISNAPTSMYASNHAAPGVWSPPSSQQNPQYNPNYYNQPQSLPPPTTYGQPNYQQPHIQYQQPYNTASSHQQPAYVPPSQYGHQQQPGFWNPNQQQQAYPHQTLPGQIPGTWNPNSGRHNPRPPAHQ